MSKWDDAVASLEASASGIDATALSLEDTENFFDHLEDDEAERVAELIQEQVENVQDSKKLIANIMDTLSSIAGITLRIMA